MKHGIATVFMSAGLLLCATPKLFAQDRSSDVLMIFALADCAVSEKLFTPDQANDWINKMIQNAGIPEQDVTKVVNNPRVNAAVQYLIESSGGCKKIISRM